MFTAVDEELDFILKLLQDNYEIKNRGRLGGGPKDVQDIVILGRIVKLHSWGLSWQADPRHREMILEHFGMDERTKSLSKNGYKEEVPNEGEQEEELQADEAREFRGLAARANYLAQDDPSIQFPAKEICRSMAKPTASDFGKLKRLARFLVGVDEVKFRYPWQAEEKTRDLKVIVDSDWAGCKVTRKSTSGGIIRLGEHMVKSWSTPQPTIALSSGEAEFYATAEEAA